MIPRIRKGEELPFFCYTVCMIVVGLGNPGGQYEKTRHNAGFMALDHVAKEHGFSEFQSSSKYHALVSEGAIQGIKVVLAKPETYMNNSGKAVKALCKNSNEDIVIIHDEIDLPLGTTKVSEKSGSAGHKGVESVMQELGTKDFARIRIGIQPLEGKPADVEEFVLQKFSPQELPLLQKSLEDASHLLLDFVRRG